MLSAHCAVRTLKLRKKRQLFRQLRILCAKLTTYYTEIAATVVFLLLLYNIHVILVLCRPVFVKTLNLRNGAKFKDSLNLAPVPKFSAVP